MTQSKDITGEFRTKNGGLAEEIRITGDAAMLLRQAATGPTDVALRQAGTQETSDQALWIAIRNRTDAIGFNRYQAFIDRLLSTRKDAGTAAFTNGGNPPTTKNIGTPSIEQRALDLDSLPTTFGVDPYQLLKLATHAFLMFESGVVIAPPRNPDTGAQAPSPDAEIEGEEGRNGRKLTFKEAQDLLSQYLSTEVGGMSSLGLPYLKRVAQALLPAESRDEGSAFSEGMLLRRFSCPSMVELIHSFWMEQGCVAQSINAIALRFQNRRSGLRDPLVNFALAPLRPLSNLLWGFIQDTQRLSVRRRASEYQFQYGLNLDGKAVAGLDVVESRSKFLQSFHDLLRISAEFLRDDRNMTIVSDGFELLSALKDLHIILAEGLANQGGELPLTARAEFLIAQWLLARQEMRDFLRGRPMTPYQEAWMGTVDHMKRLQGWPEESVNHFGTLARTGERLLLSIRLTDFITLEDQEHARNWARSQKPEIQSYIHAYQAVTGVDLTAGSDTALNNERYLQPSEHLRRRLAAGRGAALPAGASFELESAERGVYDGAALAPARLRPQASKNLLGG